ncbi:MAG: phosphate starvation-inducible protein PhoH, partial [Deltaproteobacteria bacterium]|nr:phosphate starvation-inducible protein PhoH [Deltaproteobacteria bacterium]
MSSIPKQEEEIGSSIRLQLDDNGVAQILFGPSNSHLKLIEKIMGVSIAQRANELTLAGNPDQVVITRR